MGFWDYIVLLSYLLPLTMGLALWFQKRLPFVSKVLWAYLLFTVCVEIAGAILASNGSNNLWLSRVYVYAELVFPSFFFFNQFSEGRSRKQLLTVLLLAAILITLTNLFDDWQTSASLQTGITFGYVAFIIISYFVQMFRTEKVFNPFKDIYFVVGAVILLAHSGTLIYDVLYDYVITGVFGEEIHPILNGVNLGLILFYNILYSYALWISRLRLI